MQTIKLNHDQTSDFMMPHTLLPAARSISMILNPTEKSSSSSSSSCCRSGKTGFEEGGQLPEELTQVCTVHTESSHLNPAYPYISHSVSHLLSVLSLTHQSRSGEVKYPIRNHEPRQQQLQRFISARLHHRSGVLHGFCADR